jgi:hypothetical protein
MQPASYASAVNHRAQYNIRGYKPIEWKPMRVLRTSRPIRLKLKRLHDPAHHSYPD